MQSAGHRLWCQGKTFACFPIIQLEFFDCRASVSIYLIFVSGKARHCIRPPWQQRSKKPWHAVSSHKKQADALPLSFSGSVFPSSVPITIRDISRPWALSQEQIKHYVVNTSTRNVSEHKILPSWIKRHSSHKSYTYPIEALLSFLISPWRIAHSLRLSSH